MWFGKRSSLVLILLLILNGAQAGVTTFSPGDNGYCATALRELTKLTGNTQTQGTNENNVVFERVKDRRAKYSRYVIRSKDSRWKLSMFEAVPNAPLGNPDRLIDIFGERVASHLGFERLAKNRMIIPSVEYLNFAIRRWNASLDIDHPAKMLVTFYPVKINGINRNYARRFIREFKLPMGKRGLLVHDLYFHATANLLPNAWLKDVFLKRLLMWEEFVRWAPQHVQIVGQKYVYTFPGHKALMEKIFSEATSSVIDNTSAVVAVTSMGNPHSLMRIMPVLMDSPHAILRSFLKQSEYYLGNTVEVSEDLTVYFDAFLDESPNRELYLQVQPQTINGFAAEINEKLKAMRAHAETLPLPR